MKSLSMTQPWATLVACHQKKIETRSWNTSHHGLLAIHAAKGFPVECRELCEEGPFDEALREAGMQSWRDLPRGAIIATCVLVACVPTIRAQESLQPRLPWGFDGLSEKEECFGDYTPGRWAWLLGDVRQLAAQIPATGHLGLWEYDVEALLREEEATP